MKRIVICILLILLVIVPLFSGCDGRGGENSDDRFVTVHVKAGFNGGEAVIADKATGVMYLFEKFGYGGGLSVMYNPDGTVMTYEQFTQD